MKIFIGKPFIPLIAWTYKFSASLIIAHLYVPVYSQTFKILRSSECHFIPWFKKAYTFIFLVRSTTKYLPIFFINGLLTNTMLIYRIIASDTELFKFSVSLGIAIIISTEVKRLSRKVYSNEKKKMNIKKSTQRKFFAKRSFNLFSF